MNVFVSRDGQTFGPYTIAQAKQYLEAGQLFSNDFALFEGQTEWKALHELLVAQPEVSPDQQTNDASHGEQATSQGSSVEQTMDSSVSKPKVSKSAGKKVHKIQGGAKVQTVYVAQKKGLLSKIFSTVLVFSFMMILAVGGIVGAFYAVPETMGPILKKFGLPMERLISDTSLAENQQDGEVKRSGTPKSPDEISLDEEAFQTLRQSGIRILPMENDKGLQIIAPADPPIEDKDLATLIPIADHVVSLDLTNSKVTDQGVSTLTKLANLRKLNMEGASQITVAGAMQLKTLSKLEHLNLINIQLEDSIIESFLNMENLREVYLHKTGLSEEAIKKLREERPKMFVNAG